MARRTRKKQSKQSNPLPMIIGAVCAIALLAGGYLFLTKENTSNVSELNVETYANSPESLRGSSFTVKAEVTKKRFYEEGVTQLVQVTYNNEPIVIEIPADVDGPNINTQQEYTFIVKAKNDAWLVAKSYTDK
jgi:hypothetical protein